MQKMLFFEDKICLVFKKVKTQVSLGHLKREMLFGHRLEAKRHKKIRQTQTKSMMEIALPVGNC